jgi:hypothetical protein
MYLWELRRVMLSTEATATLTQAVGTLSRGDPLGALNALGAATHPQAQALRGIALAQLGEHAAARRLLVSSHNAFVRTRQPLFAARCGAALAELAAADHELEGARERLEQARTSLRRFGDRTNAAWVGIVAARLCTLLGERGRAAVLLRGAQKDAHPKGHAFPRLDAALSLAHADLLLRNLRATEAAQALESARWGARRAGHSLLVEETERLLAQLSAPAATVDGAPATLFDIERLLRRRDAFVVDGLRRRLLTARRTIDLRRRPVLFELLAALAEASPGALPAGDVFARAFGTRLTNASHTARLRVELSRLRAVLRGAAALEAGPAGWTLLPAGGLRSRCIRSLHEGPRGALWGLLSDGSLWSAAALARVLRLTPRTVQRALAQMGAELRVFGKGPARRYAAVEATAAIATRMLLVAAEQAR